MRSYFYLFLIVIVCSCKDQSTAIDIPPEQSKSESKHGWGLLILGVAQDAGYPQAGCDKKCCKKAFEKGIVEYPTCLAVINYDSNKYWLFEATPDVKYQLKLVSKEMNSKEIFLPEAIYITHAHMGHYAGLMHFGREVMGAKNQVVKVMPTMNHYLRSNGPWSQLVSIENILLDSLKNGVEDRPYESFNVTPMLVPHRDEFSETVGFVMEVNGSKVLFIPDIDKWDRWDLSIDSLIHEVDYAFLDGTFFQEGELPGRNMSEIPHPFVQETMHRLEGLSLEEKKKVHFIHFNHTNPLLFNIEERAFVEREGYRIANRGDYFPL